MVNKRGWIKIVEAFIGIMLIMVVLLIVVTQGYTKTNESSKIYEQEVGVLRDIELNKSLRQEVLNAEMGGEIPDEIETKINNDIPTYLNCIAKICDIREECNMGEEIEKDIYVQSIFIAGNLNTYSPRQLRLFCWIK